MAQAQLDNQIPRQSYQQQLQLMDEHLKLVEQVRGIIRLTNLIIEDVNPHKRTDEEKIVYGMSQDIYTMGALLGKETEAAKHDPPEKPDQINHLRIERRLDVLHERLQNLQQSLKNNYPATLAEGKTLLERENDQRLDPAIRVSMEQFRLELEDKVGVFDKLDSITQTYNGKQWARLRSNLQAASDQLSYLDTCTDALKGNKSDLEFNMYVTDREPVPILNYFQDFEHLRKPKAGRD